MHPSHPFHDMLAVLQDGSEFYTEAAKAAENPAYRSLFERMAGAKRTLITQLQAREPGTPVSSKEEGTWLGSMRQSYTELRAKMSKHPDEQYIRQLEAAEDRILDTFRDATKSDDSTVRAAALAHLSDVQRMHDEMRALKQQVKQAA